MSRRYLTVSALTRYIKHKLDTDPHLQEVHVKGEISNFYLHRMSGHMYLTIKDESTQLKAVMFKGENRHLKFEPETGMSVYVSGHVSVYPKDGQYQLYINRMDPSGIGELHLAYEQLKKKLQKANYFSEEYKLPIPTFPKKIAVITSRDSAAVRDIITTIEKRFPIVQLVILPVNVQGEQSAPSIVRAIEQANKYDFDTIIVARGGGSIEDLASYNDERVAMAIFHSAIPVITGVGHETDMTISDFVADLRAPTPTGAAQFAVPSLQDTKRTITHLQSEIDRLVRMAFLKKGEHLKRMEQSNVLTSPLRYVKEKGQQTDQLTDRLQAITKEKMYEKEKQLTHMEQRLNRHHPQEMLALSLQRTSMLETKLKNKLRESLQRKQHKLALSIEKLTLLNPLNIMKRGYSITYSIEDEVIKSTAQLQKDDQVKLTLYDGVATCKVQEVEQKNDE